MSPSFQKAIVLREMGSFFVGGRRLCIEGHAPLTINVNRQVERDITVDLNGEYQAEHMYVQYFLPQDRRGKFPLLFWHGGGMTGAVYESTPDGRIGWRNYFIQQGWDSYVCDSVERGRSGWMPIDEIFSREVPVLIPMHYAFERYRLGASYTLGQTFAHSKFPMQSYEQYAMQFVPRWTGSSQAIVEAYCCLLKKLGPSVILAHSQGATLAFDVIRRVPRMVKAFIAVEPYGVVSEDEVPLFDSIPILWVMGDNMEKHPAWKVAREKIIRCHRQLLEHGASSDLLNLPELGILGNSHMLMMEMNNLEIARMLQDWLIRYELCEK